MLILMAGMLKRHSWYGCKSIRLPFSKPICITGVHSLEGYSLNVQFVWCVVCDLVRMVCHVARMQLSDGCIPRRAIHHLNMTTLSMSDRPATTATS